MSVRKMLQLCCLVCNFSLLLSFTKKQFSIEFINLVSSEANEICNKDQRKTIAPEHVLQSLGVSDQFLRLLALRVCLHKVSLLKISGSGVFILHC